MPPITTGTATLGKGKGDEDRLGSLSHPTRPRAPSPSPCLQSDRSAAQARKAGSIIHKENCRCIREIKLESAWFDKCHPPEAFSEMYAAAAAAQQQTMSRKADVTLPCE